MVLTDPQAVILQLLDPMYAGHGTNQDNLTKDDGSTAAKFEACMPQTDNLLELLFITPSVKLDLLYVVSKAVKRAASAPAIGYIHEVTVTPVAVTKWNSSGTVIVTASRMVDKAAQELRRVINNNPVGSMRVTERETREVMRVGATLIWGEPIVVLYTQFVTVYGRYGTVTAGAAIVQGGLRRFRCYIYTWNVGVDSSNYATVGEASGLGTLHSKTSDPVSVRLIPKGTARFQVVGSFYEEWWIRCRDQEAVQVLLYETNIDASANKAVAAADRDTIGYMVVIEKNVTITNTTDGRTTGTRTYTFTNALVRTVDRLGDEIGEYWEIHGVADAITITDA